MSYRKAEIVELARERAYRYGNQDNAKSVPFIESYLSAAVNYALNQQYYIDLKTGEDKDFNGLFLGVYENWPVQWNANRKVHFIDLPGRIIPLPKDRGLPYIGPMYDETLQYPIVGQTSVSNSGDYFQFAPMSFAQIEGTKVILRNHNDVVNAVLVKLIRDVSDLTDEDTVPIPAGLEPQVIDMVAQFIAGRRALPEDNKNDGRE